MQVYLNGCGTFRKLPIFSANRTEMHRHWHVRVVAIVITGELAEGPAHAAVWLRPTACVNRRAHTGPSLSRPLSCGATSNSAVLQTTTVNSFDREIETSNRRGLRMNGSSRRGNCGYETVAETAMMSFSSRPDFQQSLNEGDIIVIPINEIPERESRNLTVISE